MVRGGQGVRLLPGGLEIAGQAVPLYAGCVHYWRLDPRYWRNCLQAVARLGLRLVDTYVPWSVHEVGPGLFEFGERDPQRDVAAFLRLAAELGLWAIVRPGPHINAELTFFGIPERIVWDPACQARSASGNPVLLPCPPVAFPVPSYASESYAEQVEQFFRRLGPILQPLVYPAGPIVMLQVDNEGAMYFRDGVYDQDYHPDAIAAYRAFLTARYRSDEALNAAYGPCAPGAGRGPDQFDLRCLQAPTHFDAHSAQQLTRHLDWAHFQEVMLSRALRRFAGVLAEVGLGAVPTMHNFPVAEHTTALNPSLIGQAVDLVGLDYYGRAGSDTRRSVARRTGELAVRCQAKAHPAYGCEVGAGFPPFFPPLYERDNAFTILTALAYGLRGFNVYMAVDRDRWINAPIDSQGRTRSSARFWQRLVSALEQTEFHRLRRRVPVRIIVPRAQQRLTRVMHAFGPASGAVMAVLGFGPRDCCFEHDLGLGYHPVLGVETFVRRFERALESQGVPFALVGTDGNEQLAGDAEWVICASSGALEPELVQRLLRATEDGRVVTVGPQRPRWDGAWNRRLGAEAERLWDRCSRLTTVDSAAVEAVVGRYLGQLELPRLHCDSVDVFVTLHEDVDGRPRVLFAINPSEQDQWAQISSTVPFRAARDLFDSSEVACRSGALELRLRARSVRMLALS